MYRLQDAPTRLLSLSSIPWSSRMLAPPYNAQVFLLLASYDRAMSLTVPLAANSHSPTILPPERIRVRAPNPTGISDLPPTRRAPNADIHSCPTYRV
jgi:hypothetical protein